MPPYSISNWDLTVREYTTVFCYLHYEEPRISPEIAKSEVLHKLMQTHAASRLLV